MPGDPRRSRDFRVYICDDVGPEEKGGFTEKDFEKAIRNAYDQMGLPVIISLHVEEVQS